MGWDYCHATHYKNNGQVDRKAELDSRYTWETEQTKASVLKSSMVGSVYYAAVNVETLGEKTNEVFGLVVRTAGKDRGDPWFNFGYKSMDETMGPCYYDCPKKILDLLTPTENAAANEWRRKCKEAKHTTKLSDLKVGTVIRFACFGKNYELEKKAPNFQFRHTWWYNAENNTYVPSRRIPKNFEVVTA